MFVLYDFTTFTHIGHCQNDRSLGAHRVGEDFFFSLV